MTRGRRILLAGYLVIGVAWCSVRTVISAGAPLGLVAVIAAVPRTDVPFAEKMLLPMLLGMDVAVPILAWPLDIVAGLSVGPSHTGSNHGRRGSWPCGPRDTTSSLARP